MSDDLDANLNDLDSNLNDLCKLLVRYPESIVRQAPSRWNWTRLSENPSIPLRFIEQTMDDPRYRWKWGCISRNPNLRNWFVKKYINKGWNWEMLAIHPYIDHKKNNVTLNGKRYRRNFRTWGENKHIISMEMIEETLSNDKCDLNFWYISKNPNLTFDFVQRHIDENWDWYELSKHRNITLSMIEKYSHYKWCESIFGNPNLTYDFVVKHDNPNFKLISSNTFEKTNAAKKIQRVWKKYWYEFTQTEPVTGLKANRHLLNNLKEMKEFLV